MDDEFRKIEPNVVKFSQEGEEITGKLIKVGDSSKYAKGKIYHLEVTNEQTGQIENKVIFSSTILEDRMSFVNVGEIVKIKFIRLEKNKKGQDMKVFEVYKKS